jgi:hypothetical protein
MDILLGLRVEAISLRLILRDLANDDRTLADTLMSQRIEANETRIKAIEKRLPPIESLS